MPYLQPVRILSGDAGRFDGTGTARAQTRGDAHVGLFEFLMVLVSVVIGLGITEILSGWANLLRARSDVRFYWIHVLFQFGVFFALLQQWWEFWDMARVGELSFLAVLTVLAPPVFLYLIAHLLFPVEARGADLEEYYYRQAPLLWGLVVLGTLEGTLVTPLVFHYQILHPANLSGIPMILICVVLARSTDRRVHAVLAPAVLVLVLLDTILSNPVISSG